MGIMATVIKERVIMESYVMEVDIIQSVITVISEPVITYNRFPQAHGAEAERQEAGRLKVSSRLYAQKPSTEGKAGEGGRANTSR